MTDERIIKLYEEGKSIARIAKIGKCERHDINNRLVVLREAGKVGLRDTRGGGEKSATAKEKRKEKILSLRLAGKLTNDQIAEKVGISAQHVRALASELIAEGKLVARINRFDLVKRDETYIAPVPQPKRTAAEKARDKRMRVRDSVVRKKRRSLDAQHRTKMTKK